MPGYLLDLNHVQALFNQVPIVVARAGVVGSAQLRASAITCGELEAGHRMTAAGCITLAQKATRAKYTTWFNHKFLANVAQISESTRIYYADIVDAIYKNYPPKKGIKTERHFVLNLGVDVNDVWLAACALEHGLILVTRDGMDKVRAAVLGMGLIIQNWIDDPPNSPPIVSPPPSALSASALPPRAP